MNNTLMSLLLLTMLPLVMLYLTMYDTYWAVLQHGETKAMSKVRTSKFRAWDRGYVTSVEPEVEVNCSRVMSGDTRERIKIMSLVSGWRNALTDEALMKKMQNCFWLRDSFSNNLYNSKLEKSFPIAFTFVVHDSPQQVLRLLRLLYRPQNSYCIHCDAKSPHNAFFQKIASCFENIIVPSKLIDVVWGKETIMEAQMSCMTDLVKLRAKEKYKWKYVINLCGKELPLMTNREMVERLIKLNGSSSIMAHKLTAREFEYRMKESVKNYSFILSQLAPPSFNDSAFYKSSSYNAISIQFARFLVFNRTVRKFREFFKLCRYSEEHFYATVYMLPHVPGGYDKHIDHYFYIEKAFWIKPEGGNPISCLGKVVHDICIITALDLPKVMKAHMQHPNSFFHNKYFMELDHTVIRCMEERIVAQNRLEYEEEENCDSYRNRSECEE